MLIERDNVKLKALFVDTKNIINNDVPYIGLFFYTNAIIYNKKLKGDINPHIWDKYNNIAQWYIP